eukprot:327726_1
MAQNDIQINPSCTEFKKENSEYFSILSWNIMHKEFGDPKDYPYCNKEQLLWKHRLPKIKQKIFSHNTDIVCLQEIDKLSFSADIGEYFKTNHAYDYVINTGKKVKHSTAIMFKNNKFICKYKDFRTRSTILLLTQKKTQLNCSKCCKDNICIYHSVFIVTVHLSAKGTQWLSRINQTKSLLNRIKHCITNELKLKLNQNEINKYIPIIIIGDFNTWIPSELCQMLLIDNYNKFKHNYMFKEAYFEAMISNFNPYLKQQKLKYNLESNDSNLKIKLFPTYAGYNKIYSIDLCFYTNNNLKVKRVNNTLSEEYKKKLQWNDIIQKRIDEKAKTIDSKLEFWKNMADFSDIFHLPNHEWPSDHLPIAILFEYKNLCQIRNMNSNKCICHKKKEKQKLNNWKNKRKNISQNNSTE